MHKLVFLSLLSGASAMRRHKMSKWSTLADGENGPCADAVAIDFDDTWQPGAQGPAGDLPISFPLLCTSDSSNLKFQAVGKGYRSANFSLYIDNEFQDTMQFWQHWVGEVRTFEVDVASLSAGVHSIRFEGGLIDFMSVTLEGIGGSCSFTDAPNYNEALTSYTYRGLDVVNRLFGDDRDFSASRKKQLYFSSETVGANDDGSISSKVVAEGFWKWMLSYSQDASRSDPWLKDPEGLWDEAKILPWPSVSLKYIDESRSGQEMTVVEPCNTLSNLAYHHAANWASCKGHSFTRDEYASVMAALNGLAPGSSFLHACACRVGGRADTFTMDWLMLQLYQIMVKTTVEHASGSLSSAERDTLMFFGDKAGMATDVARNMTALMSEKYNHEQWKSTMDSITVPAYEMPIAGLIAFTAYVLDKNGGWPEGLGDVDSLIFGLLDAFDIPDGDWYKNTYIPTVKKALESVSFCSDSTQLLLDKFWAFTVTFVEALVFQEKKIPVPDFVRDLVDWLRRNGLASESMEEMKGDWNYYNGFDCKARSDHAIWHEKAGHGLVHNMQIANMMTTRMVAKGKESDC